MPREHAPPRGGYSRGRRDHESALPRWRNPRIADIGRAQGLPKANEAKHAKRERRDAALDIMVRDGFTPHEVALSLDVPVERAAKLMIEHGADPDLLSLQIRLMEHDR